MARKLKASFKSTWIIVQTKMMYLLLLVLLLYCLFV